MTKITFENAVIRDAINKAARIAPTKGTAMDKAAGILIKIDTTQGKAIVKATNTDVYYMEIVDCLSVEGDDVTWRVNSMIVDGVCSKLPVSSGQTSTFNDEQPGGSTILISSGRMRAHCRILDPSYFPEWGAFDPSLLLPVPDFAARLESVQWAAAKSGEPPLGGIHLTGSQICATDRFKIALAPCDAAHLYKPVTIPAGILSPLMKNLGDVRIGIGDSEELYFMPDDATQIRTVIYANKYPNVPVLMEKNQPPNSVSFKKSSLLEVIERAMVFGQRERIPVLKMILGEEEVAVMMEDQELGLLGDVVETPGQAQHERFTIMLNPNNFTPALNSSPNEDMTMRYTFGNAKKPVRLDGGSGYECLVMPRSGDEKEEGNG